MLNRLVLVLPAIFCWGCAGLFPRVLTQQGSAVRIADENVVRQCQYVGEVTGGAGNTEYARNDARNLAAAMGATHVVFVSETANQALAHAYDRATVRGPLLVPSSQ